MVGTFDISWSPQDLIIDIMRAQVQPLENGVELVVENFVVGVHSRSSIVRSIDDCVLGNR